MKTEENKENTFLNLANQMMELTEDQKNLLRGMEKESNRAYAKQKCKE